MIEKLSGKNYDENFDHDFFPNYNDIDMQNSDSTRSELPGYSVLADMESLNIIELSKLVQFKKI